MAAAMLKSRLFSCMLKPAKISKLLHTTGIRRSSLVTIAGKQVDTRWLRENCHCPECYNHNTDQRNVLFYALSKAELGIKAIAEDSRGVNVTWQDGHNSTYENDFMHSQPQLKNKEYQPKLWNGEQLKSMDIKAVPASKFLLNDDGLKAFLSSLLVNGYGLVSDIEPTIDATEEVCRRVGVVQNTMYGGMWSFTGDQSRADTAYTNLGLGAHTDNTYFTLPSGIQVFHCMYHDGSGGETLLVDGFNAAESLRTSNPKAFQVLCDYPIHHRNKEEDRYLMRSLAPVLSCNPITGQLENIRYNHYDRETLTTIPQAQIGPYYDALAALSTRIIDPEAEFWIKLKPGTVLFVDNWRVLHGRAAYTGRREVCGAYIARDDWRSKARVQGLINY